VINTAKSVIYRTKNVNYCLIRIFHTFFQMVCDVNGQMRIVIRTLSAAVLVVWSYTKELTLVVQVLQCIIRVSSAISARTDLLVGTIILVVLRFGVYVLTKMIVVTHSTCAGRKMVSFTIDACHQTVLHICQEVQCSCWQYRLILCWTFGTNYIYNHDICNTFCLVHAIACQLFIERLVFNA
jgi:hypothetical protein